MLEGDRQPCAKVQASSSVVALGSSVTATCVISDSCPLLIEEAAQIKWRIDNRFLPSDLVTSEGTRVSKVVIPNVNVSRAFLTCCVQASPLQVVGGVEIRAGCEKDFMFLFFINNQVHLPGFLKQGNFKCVE